MKFAFKSIVVAAAFVAAGTASAASVVVDGTTNNNGFLVEGRGALEFSELLMGALITGNVAVTPFGEGGTIGSVVRTGVDDFGDAYEYTALIADADVTSLNFDAATGKVINVQSVGGAAQQMAANPGIKAAGGSAQVGNLDVRFLSNGNVEIYGTITGQRLGASTAVNYSGLVFTATAADVTGATSFIAAPGVYETTIKNLASTDAAFTALVQSFGLNSSGLGYSALAQATANFGTLQSTITVTAAPIAAIPEPSTYALMGLGLVGIGFAARRRAK